jgi:hypothetical protein
LARLRIIVADDNPAFLRELTSLLAPGFDVVATAANGRSALDLIRHYRPDLVVLDLGMPLLNGIDVTRELAKHGPPVVICSVRPIQRFGGGCATGGSVGLCFQSTGRKGFDPGGEISTSGQALLCHQVQFSVIHL